MRRRSGVRHSPRRIAQSIIATATTTIVTRLVPAEHHGEGIGYFALGITLATAMLHTGSVLGNVIALQNVVMARSALEEDIPEAEVLRYSSRLLLVCILLVLASAAVWQGLGH